MRIRLDQTHNDFLRYEQLYGQKAVTRQQYDNAKADYDATKAKYDMLVRSKRSTALMKDEQTRRLEQNQTNIDVARAEQHLAELNLSYTVIVAPCDGVTSRRSIQEGQFIQPGQTLLSLVEDNNVWVLANYKETQTANIREGMPVSIKVDAVPGVVYYGEVEVERHGRAVFDHPAGQLGRQLREGRAAYTREDRLHRPEQQERYRTPALGDERGV